MIGLTGDGIDAAAVPCAPLAGDSDGVCFSVGKTATDSVAARRDCQRDTATMAMSALNATARMRGVFMFFDVEGGASGSAGMGGSHRKPQNSCKGHTIVTLRADIAISRRTSAGRRLRQ